MQNIFVGLKVWESLCNHNGYSDYIFWLYRGNQRQKMKPHPLYVIHFKGSNENALKRSYMAVFFFSLFLAARHNDAIHLISPHCTGMWWSHCDLSRSIYKYLSFVSFGWLAGQKLQSGIGFVAPFIHRTHSQRLMGKWYVRESGI